MTIKVWARIPEQLKAKEGMDDNQKFKARAKYIALGRHAISGGRRPQAIAQAEARVQGTKCRFLQPDSRSRVNRITERDLTRVEVVFGVAAPQDGKGGGWKALVDWIWHEDGLSEIHIDMERATHIGANEWILDFVRTIFRSAGWQEEKP